MKEVEILGGPEDGKVIAVQDEVTILHMPYMIKPPIYEVEPTLRASVTYLRVDLPIILTPNGYRAYWKEPSC